MDGLAPGMLSNLVDMMRPKDEDSDSDEDKVSAVETILLASKPVCA